jgi:hypothetical protein
MESLRGYLEHGRPVGSFLTAVLSNDLKRAVAKADDVNLPLLPAYVSYLYDHAPYASWGSEQAVETWIATHAGARRI